MMNNTQNDAGILTKALLVLLCRSGLNGAADPTARRERARNANDRPAIRDELSRVERVGRMARISVRPRREGGALSKRSKDEARQGSHVGQERGNRI
ncbi:hypothetical protein DL771_010462 [Monosporascus sp. 5C6A]|nr:hypothetical protein DL771_010462 [Monosporascus sp. 5C6A]